MRVVLSILLFLLLTPSFAQDVKKQINAIKRSQDYINAEATHTSREEAFALALEELASEINTLFVSSLSSQELKGITKSLEVKRGESMRVFVYVLKNDLNTLRTAKSNPAIQDTTKKEEDATIPMKELQAEEPQTAEEGTVLVKEITSVFARMNTFTEIKSLLRQYKEEGKLSEFNWVTTTKVPAYADVIIFRDEKIAAILLQESNGKRINYLTNKEDNISNYRGCRAIWYKK